MSDLKDRQAKILKFMKKVIKTKGYPPTVREISHAVGIKSTSTVHSDIKKLVELGYIKKDPAKPRALVIVEQEKDKKEKEYSTVVEIPVIGQIAAGAPILADENITDTIPVPERFLSNSENYLLTVKGDSMINVGIMNGDYIIVEHCNTAKNGEIVVAVIQDYEAEATVKTFYNEGDRIRLQPENDTMEPIYPDNCEIVGKVSGVFRYYN